MIYSHNTVRTAVDNNPRVKTKRKRKDENQDDDSVLTFTKGDEVVGRITYGAPKGTGYYTADELKAKGMVGVYYEGVVPRSELNRI